MGKIPYAPNPVFLGITFDELLNFRVHTRVHGGPGKGHIIFDVSKYSKEEIIFYCWIIYFMCVLYIRCVYFMIYACVFYLTLRFNHS